MTFVLYVFEMHYNIIQNVSNNVQTREINNFTQAKMQ